MCNLQRYFLDRHGKGSLQIQQPYRHSRLHPNLENSRPPLTPSTEESDGVYGWARRRTGSCVIRFPTVQKPFSIWATVWFQHAVHDLSIDKTGGYLWVATNAGLSRMSLGHTASAVADNKTSLLIPIRSPEKNTQPSARSFSSIALSGAKINVYTLRGALVKVLSSDADNAYPFDTGPFETTLRWVPLISWFPGRIILSGSPSNRQKHKNCSLFPDREKKNLLFQFNRFVRTRGCRSAPSN